MKDPYEILGLTKDADPDQIRARYEALRSRYSEQRYQDGEMGNEGARLLSELESAWSVIEQDLRRRETSGKGGDYGYIESQIRAGKYDQAQDALDSITNRDAKWHYFQSIIFYKRDWLSESRSQLELAIQLDPGNEKYKESLRKLDMVMGNPNANAQQFANGNPYADPNSAYYQQQYQQQQYQQQQYQQQNDAANTCANCALCYCLSESCCTMTRCCS